MNRTKMVLNRQRPWRKQFSREYDSDSYINLRTKNKCFKGKICVSFRKDTFQDKKSAFHDIKYTIQVITGTLSRICDIKNMWHI